MEKRTVPFINFTFSQISLLGSIHTIAPMTVCSRYNLVPVTSYYVHIIIWNWNKSMFTLSTHIMTRSMLLLSNILWHGSMFECEWTGGWLVWILWIPSLFVVQKYFFRTVLDRQRTVIVIIMRIELYSPRITTSWSKKWLQLY